MASRPTRCWLCSENSTSKGTRSLNDLMKWSKVSTKTFLQDLYVLEADKGPRAEVGKLCAKCDPLVDKLDKSAVEMWGLLTEVKARSRKRTLKEMEKGSAVPPPPVNENSKSPRPTRLRRVSRIVHSPSPNLAVQKPKRTPVVRQNSQPELKRKRSESPPVFDDLLEQEMQKLFGEPGDVEEAATGPKGGGLDGFLQENGASSSLGVEISPRRSKPPEFDCKSCDKMFVTKSGLTAHWADAHKDTPNFCNCCGKTYSSPGVLNRHKKNVEEKEQEEAKGKCEQCGMEKIKDMAEHRLNFHSEPTADRPIRPESNTPQPQGSKSNLAANLSPDPADVEDPSSDNIVGDFLCDECGEVFTKKARWAVHMKRTHGWDGTGNEGPRSEPEATPKVQEGDNTCSECTETFDDARKLRLHMLKAHGISQAVMKLKPSYECKICSEDCIASPLLVAHMSKCHGNTESYKCGQCSKSFNLKESLDDHVKTHVVSDIIADFDLDL